MGALKTIGQVAMFPLRAIGEAANTLNATAWGLTPEEQKRAMRIRSGLEMSPQEINAQGLREMEVNRGTMEAEAQRKSRERIALAQIPGFEAMTPEEQDALIEQVTGRSRSVAPAERGRSLAGIAQSGQGWWQPEAPATAAPEPPAPIAPRAKAAVRTPARTLLPPNFMDTLRAIYEKVSSNSALTASPGLHFKQAGPAPATAPAPDYSTALNAAGVMAPGWPAPNANPPVGPRRGNMGPTEKIVSYQGKQYRIVGYDKDGTPLGEEVR